MKEPNLEEKVQLQTVNHRLRTALIAGAISAIIAAVTVYLGLK